MGTSAASRDEGGSGPAAGGAADLQEKVGEKVSGALETVRGKTGNMQATLADLMDSSARVIRSRATAVPDTAAAEKLGDAASEQVMQAGATAADVLERGAMWLRENDLSDLEGRVTTHLKANPASSLLIAAGVGFLLSRRRR